MMIPGVNGSVLASAYKASKLKRRYADGGPIKPSARLNNINPRGEASYQAGLQSGPINLNFKGTANIPQFKNTSLDPSLEYKAKSLSAYLTPENVGGNYEGKSSYLSANYNMPSSRTNLSAGYNSDKLSVNADASLDKTSLMEAGVNANYNITPNLSLFGDLRWNKQPGEAPTSYNVGFRYKKEFGDGGKNRLKTSLSPQEEKQFLGFFNTLPSNLKVDNDNYDIRGYWDALGRPEKFDYNQPKEDDGMYHAFSRHPESGKMLKSMTHPTSQMAIQGDKKAGYSHAVDINGNVYSFSPNDMPTKGPFASFNKGGITNDPPKRKMTYDTKSKTSNTRSSIYKDAESIVNQETQTMQSPEYAALLQKEFYGDNTPNQNTKERVKSRLENLATLKVDVPYMSFLDFGKDELAKYDPTRHQIKVKKDRYDPGIFRHELSHSSDSSYTKGADEVGPYFSNVVTEDLKNAKSEYSDETTKYMRDPSEVKARLKALRDASIEQGYKLMEPGYDINKYKEQLTPSEKMQYDQLKKSGVTDEQINKYMYLFAKSTPQQQTTAKMGARLQSAYMKNGGKHGGLDRWFAEKWVDVKTGEPCGRSGTDKDGRPYPACRPSKRVSSETPKTSSEMSSQEKARFKATKTSSQRIPYNHKRK